MSDVIPPRRRRFAPVVIVTGVAATLLLAFATTGALSGFTASINNSTNTAASGTLLMSETQGATTCLSSATGTVTTANAGTCATINKFSGSTALVPGSPVTSTVIIKNNGTVPANTFTLTPSGCTQGNNGTVNGTDTSFCGKIDITIADTTSATCVYPVSSSPCAATPTSAGTLTTLGTTVLTLATPLAAGAQRTYTFTLMLDGTNATNADQGLSVSEPLLWSFAS